jgi:hypothetical protein
MYTVKTGSMSIQRNEKRAENQTGQDIQKGKQYITENQVNDLVEKTSRVIQWKDEGMHIFLVDPARVVKTPKETTDGKRVYATYTFEVVESLADGEEVERDLNLSEVKAGELLKACKGEKAFVQIARVKNSSSGFYRYSIAPVE